VESKWKNYHIITFLDSLSPKTFSLKEGMDLSRDRNELLILYMYPHLQGKASGSEEGRVLRREEEALGSEEDNALVAMEGLH
jgi:hypothetical protein